ncbi:MAG: ribonuclease HII [Holosporales bacterium]|jgi:ribonuclease HII|nr:ribonuclease HII [Holosporales bacterium]
MPSFEHEAQFAGRVVAGVDEAGRGPLAGPVVAAAVVIREQEGFLQEFAEVDDSKKLSPKKRRAIYAGLVASSAIQFGVGSASVEEIDELNILNATFLAMRRALDTLEVSAVLVDGNKKITGCTVPCFPIVHGDRCSYSIAAASVIAKVTRDDIMLALSREFPAYKWDKNAGYGTADHLSAITSHGLTEHHRKSFAPVKLAACCSWLYALR